MAARWTLTAAAAATPDAPACVDTSSRLTFAELEARSNRWAHALHRTGLRRGDHAVLFMNNGNAMYTAVWAALKTGIFFTPLPTHSTDTELERLAGHFPSSVIVVDHETAGRCHSLQRGRSRHLLLCADGPAEGFTDLPALAAEESTLPPGDDREGIDLMFSSGTTGEPKGIRFPLPEHDDDRLGRIGKIVRNEYGGKEGSVFLSPGPLYHAASLRFSLAFTRLGGTVILPDRFDPEQTLNLVDRHRVTHLAVVPTMISRLFQLDDDIVGRYDCSSLEAVVHGAAPCPIPLKERAITRWGPILHEYYAGTEGLGFCSITSEQWLDRKGSVGRAVHGAFEIRDDEGAVVPAGVIGTVHFLGESVSRHITGPVNDPVVLPRPTTLGDTGYVDEEGFLYLTGRTSDMIISGGVNIYPREIEHVILRVPGVADAAAFAVPHDDLGEVVAAAVEPTADADVEALRSAIAAYLADHLARNKRPRTLLVQNALPRTASGKILVRELRDALSASGARV